MAYAQRPRSGPRGGMVCARRGVNANVWLQSRSLPARGRVGLEFHRCLSIIDEMSLFLRKQR